MGMTEKRVLVLCIVGSLVCLTQQPTVALSTAPQQQEQEGGAKKEKQKEKERQKEEKEEGTLATFESEATSEHPDSLQAEESEELSGWWGFFGEVALYAVLGGAVGSWYRVSGKPVDEDFEQVWGRRETGEATIPFAGLNFNYHSVKSDVEAFDVNVEGGYGPLAAHYRFTRFSEKDPDTDLDLSWLHGVVRMSYTKYVEVGLGFGAIFLKGTGSESGFSFALPVRIEPFRYLGLDYRPTWSGINGNTISDHDLGLRVGINYVSVRGGYRWTKAGGSTLEGPIVGVLLTL